MLRFSLKPVLQTVCVVLVALGIVIEALYEADIGFILITSGSLALAISTKINHRLKKPKYRDHL